MKKVIDCFIFYNELDMLDFRLKELNDCVDKFVIVEATHTFSGNTKRLHFEKSKERYSDYLHKIEHVVVDDCPNTDNPWDNEHHQRRSIRKGLEKVSPNNDDIIIISDVDEIPNSKIINQIKKDEKETQFTILELDFYYFNITTMVENKWYEGCRILSYAMFKDVFNSDSQNVRTTFTNHFGGKNISIKIDGGKYIAKGGWHFSFFGDERLIQNKLMNFSHQEYNKPNITNINEIKKCIDERRDLCGRKDGIFIYVPIEKNEFLPNNYNMLLNI